MGKCNGCKAKVNLVRSTMAPTQNTNLELQYECSLDYSSIIKVDYTNTSEQAKQQKGRAEQAEQPESKQANQANQAQQNKQAKQSKQHAEKNKPSRQASSPAGEA